MAQAIMGIDIMRLVPHAFSFYPAASLYPGMIIYVTDSTTSVVGATITGGGGNIVIGWSNGTNWKVLGS